MTGFTDEERIAAEYMLREMAEQKLAVGTAPAPHGDNRIRVAININPWWYSRLCEAHKNIRTNGRWKRPRTFIKRVDVVRTLRRIVSQETVGDLYGERLRGAIAAFIEQNGPMVVAEVPGSAEPF